MSIAFSDTVLQTFAQMNRLGQQKKPFFFAIDYEGQYAILYDADALERGVELYFDFGKHSYAPRHHQKEQSPLLTSLYPEPLGRYLQRFDRLHSALKRGDSFLGNLTIRTPITLEGSLEDIYQHASARYRVCVPGHFVCFSPEGFVDIDEQGHISTYPMKGTASHSSSAEGALELEHSDKELREHHTIVDLMRNDLSMKAQGIHVPRLRYQEQLHTSKGIITQTSSQITGTLPVGWQGQIGSIIASLLPAGSISGAPKRSTVEAIREAEGIARGYYTGVAGYYDGSTLQSAVLIRYIEQQGDKYYYRSGGGITALSIGKEEWQECIDKVYLPWEEHRATHMALLETIRVQDGSICLLQLHLDRMRSSLIELGAADSPMMRLIASGALSSHLEHYVHRHHSTLPHPTLKLRLVYSQWGIQACTLEVYRLRPIHQLRLWQADSSLDYHLKYHDRTALEQALQGAQSEVILLRNGLITDTSYSNIVLRLGDEWLTPESPLLPGVMRRHLLETGRIRAARLGIEHLRQAREIHLINAMMPLDGEHITLQPQDISPQGTTNPTIT